MDLSSWEPYALFLLSVIAVLFLDINKTLRDICKALMQPPETGPQR